MLRGRVDNGAGGILVTHDARHAAWAGRIVFLRDGRISEESTVPSVDQLLIAAMVALPIAGMAGAALVASSMSPTVPERIETELGKTQAQLRIVTRPHSS